MSEHYQELEQSGTSNPRRKHMYSPCTTITLDYDAYAGRNKDLNKELFFRQ